MILWIFCIDCAILRLSVFCYFYACFTFPWKDNWGCLVFGRGPSLFGAPLVAQTVKHLPEIRETQVRSLGREVPLENEMATHSSALARKIPWMKDPGGLWSLGLQESDTTEQLHFLFFPLFSRQQPFFEDFGLCSRNEQSSPPHPVQPVNKGMMKEKLSWLQCK